VLVIEGAGSPAEVNLKANDIVNMRVAKHLNAPVLLIADIDRGGALASLVGTLELLDEDERALVKGLVINKFRGDVTLLTPAVDFLEEKTGKPVLGIVPHIEALGIDDEDSVSLDEKDNESAEQSKADLHIAVIQTPKISNFTDFDSLAAEPDVSLYYVRKVEDLGNPDMIILPGSKNTTEDLLHLRECGLEAAIRKQVAKGTPLWGICGGYQMLGQKIADPLHMESANDEVDGLGYLPMETTFAAEKLTSQVQADCVQFAFLDQSIKAEGLYGYEIHTGETKFLGELQHPFKITERANQAVTIAEGLTSQNGAQGQVVGTYIHGIFDHDDFRRQVLNALRSRKGLEALTIQRSVRQEKERAYNRLASVVRDSLDMEKLAQIMGETSC
jgi:adenosylcobyric acid synthase